MLNKHLYLLCFQKFKVVILQILQKFTSMFPYFLDLAFWWLISILNRMYDPVSLKSWSHLTSLFVNELIQTLWVHEKVTKTSNLYYFASTWSLEALKQHKQLCIFVELSYLNLIQMSCHNVMLFFFHIFLLPWGWYENIEGIEQPGGNISPASGPVEKQQPGQEWMVDVCGKW